MPRPRSQTTRAEMLRRMNDGWELEGKFTDTEMTMVHVVSPPLWRMALDIVNPVFWIFGFPTWPDVTRRLRVWVGEDGLLHRRTTGSIPPRWPQTYSWEVPDGPIQ